VIKEGNVVPQTKTETIPKIKTTGEIQRNVNMPMTAIKIVAIESWLVLTSNTILYAMLPGVLVVALVGPTCIGLSAHLL
jgi:hypothetical protein